MARTHALVILPFVFVPAGCASIAASSADHGRGDATTSTDANADVRPETRRIRLTLRPIYDWQESATGLGEAVSLDGVKVCVARKRPWGGAWRDFVETAGPCTTSVADEPVALDGAPGWSELIVTAEKAGYMPSAFAVATERWDLDITVSEPPHRWLRMRRRDAPWATLPAGQSVDLNGAVVEVLPVACTRSGLCRSLGGVGITMDNAPVGTGPFYWKDGRFDPAGTRTSDGTLTDLFTAPAAGITGATFANVPEGDHRVAFDLRAGSCSVIGWYFGDPIWGLASSRGSVGVPVLAGHFMPNIWAICSECDPDSGSCGSDASTP